MIREIGLTRFRCFQEQRLALAPLSLLTGFNSAGKSSVAQSLLLLQHALSSGIEHARTLKMLSLNAGSLALGELRSVVNESSGGHTFSIEIGSRGSRIQWTLGAKSWPRDHLAVPVAEVVVDGVVCTEPGGQTVPFLPKQVSGDAALQLLSSLSRLRFVPADRLGPAQTYPLEDPSWHETPGFRAERVFGKLHWMGPDDIPLAALRHPAPDVSLRFDRQVEAWIADLFPGALLRTERVRDANLMTLGVRTREDTDFHRPQHVGFGITYVLPIVITLLSARQGDIVFLENPEAHLHPRAQAQISRLCARAAAAGVQVIIETHSDHVLHGTRVAVHAGHIAPEDVAILFFAPPPLEPQVTPVRVLDRTGALDRWPRGFFDEGDRLLDRLMEPVQEGG